MSKKGIDNKSCQEFLKAHGINPSDIKDAIKRQKAYDGTQSTISIGEAGLFVMGEPESSQSVRDYFASDPNLFAQTAVHGLLAGLPTRYDVYYGAEPIISSRVIHEALHSFTTLDDLLLAPKLGIPPKAGEGWSEQIARELKAHGCGG